MRTIVALGLAAGLIAGCGASESASVETLPMIDETTTTTLAQVTSTVPVVTSQALTITPELLEGMLQTDAGRELIVSGIAAQAGVDAEVASCFIDNIDLSTLAGLSSLAEPGQALDLNAAQQEDLAGAFQACDLDPALILP